MQLPPGIKCPTREEVQKIARESMRQFGVPVFYDRRLWNVEATHSRNGHHYYVYGTSVYYSGQSFGGFDYIGEKGDQNIKTHEANNGLKF